MSPRPRKASDADVFLATQRVMSRVGPGELTLAEIAAEAGITAGALVQRFGSRRDLLLRMMQEWAAGAEQQMQQFRSAYRTGLQTVYGYAECTAQMGGSPAEFAHHLSYLQLDLTDPDFHRCVKVQAATTRKALKRWLDEAVVEGELLDDVDTSVLARQVEVTMTGSLWTWAFHQEGSASSWLRTDMEVLLQPLERNPKRSARKRASVRAAARADGRKRRKVKGRRG